MRHKGTAKNPCPEKPAHLAGSIAEDNHQILEGEDCPSRLRIKVGPPEASWSHAKWLALADQALLE